MGRFHFWLPFAVFAVVGATEIQKECSSNVCLMLNKMEAVSVGREELANHLDSFASALNLPLDHRFLKEVITHLGTTMEIQPNVSMQSHLEIYQQRLLNESQKEVSPSTYLFDMKLENQLSIVDNLLGKLNMSNDKVEEIIRNAVTSLTEEFETNSNATNDLGEEIRIVKQEMCVPETTEFNPHAMSDCWDLLVAGKNETGIYTIYPHGIEKQVLCDMDSNGGGWTVFIVRRWQKVREEFRRRTWKEYKNGFGTTREYWLGNEVLHLMTTSKNYSVRVDIMGRGVWGEWNRFRVESEDDSYRMRLRGYNANSTMDNYKTFGYNNQAKFSTEDRRSRSMNRYKPDFTCAETYGAFWHHGVTLVTSYINDCSRVFPTHPTVVFGYGLSYKIRPSH